MSYMRKEFSYNVILLAAGKGSRMEDLTQEKTKGLLDCCGKKVIDWMLEAIIKRNDGEIVVVTGYSSNILEQHLQQTYGDRVKTIRNDKYEQDVNILSVEIGVAALRYPEKGYLIVETDLLLNDAAWDKVFASLDAHRSFWVCKGYYHRELTGGIVSADSNGEITVVDYQPVYDPKFDGWFKMIGMLAVGPDEVLMDRAVRQQAIAESTLQYYLTPWSKGIAFLPCRVLELTDEFASSFNTKDQFYEISKAFSLTISA